MKQNLLAAFAAGAMLLSVVGVASAAPPYLPPPANCVAQEATLFHDVAFFARGPHAGERSFVGYAASTNCAYLGEG